MSNEIIQHSEPDKFLRELINEQLINHFGVDTVSGEAIWRVAWAEDHFEKRHGTWEDYSPNGIYLRTVTETRVVPKYPHLRGKYVLEQLVGIPSVNRKDLPGQMTSYEPIHPFWNGKMEYLPPNFIVCKFIIDTVYAAMGKASMYKYVDPDADGNNGLEAKKERVKAIYDGLYGNETAVGDALEYGTGVFLDSRKQKDN